MSATGSLAAGFAMSLNNGAPADFILGSNLPVDITWSVTALSDLSFKLKECKVQHGGTGIMIVKDSCFASTLDVVPTGNKQGFSYQVFKAKEETDLNQMIECTVQICEVGQCATLTACPAYGDDQFYG